MKNRFYLFALLITATLISCGKENPENGGGDNKDEQAKNTPVLIFSHNFTTGLGQFTVQNKNKGGFEGDIWKFVAKDSKYGAQATASTNSGNVCYEAESWLISPEIDLTNYTDACLYFEHAFAYLKGNTPENHFGIKVSTDNGATWVNRAVPKWLSPYSYFELAQSGNVPLGAFAGKKIKFAFVYTSTTSVAPTWEILNVTVSYERQVVRPDDEGDQYTSVPSWMEMPSVANPDAWRAHTTILRFDRVRDYSFSYNEPCLVADWVAYPLYENFIKDKANRNNSSWTRDPFLSKQANLAAGGSYEFSSKGYDRGHQIPSADRSGGAMANQQTFYYSNATPQLHDFNSHIWEKLESAVRSWVPSEKTEPKDTLYVVSGCVVDSSCPTLKDHDDKDVAVPKAYYKALLRLKGNTYIGAGFYLDHTNDIADGNYKDYAMSLKDLESKTGMTFFVNLPADKASSIKAENPKNNTFWGLK